MKHSRRSCESPAASVRARFAKHPLAAAIAVAFVGVSGSAWAQLPTGAAVVNGTAGIATNGSAMTITNSPNAIVNWKTFSIGAHNSVRFEQQNAASQILNRVVGNDPSSILGRLSSNGGVWLVNPHGVLFGPNARIDVAGLVASTLAITNDDFLARRFRFEGAGPLAGKVLNQGEINTSFGGRVWLMGDSVQNEGLVRAPGGNIVLAAGKSIELVDSGMPNVTVRVTAPDNEAVNLGTLIATAGGSIDLHGGIVNQQGIVRADSFATDAAGRVVIKAQGDVKLGDASTTSASSQGAGAGGQVVVQSAGGTTSLSGQVAAASTDGKGGQVQLLGNHVGLFGHAVADASGATGGGEVLVGGDYQGGNPAVANATAAYLGPDATLRANATGDGDGGKVIVWGSEMARVYGTIEAKGGPAGGNGGFVETSGAYLDARPKSLQVDAPAGAPGTWLLDPFDITIAGEDSFGTYTQVNGVFTSTTDSSQISSFDISDQLSRGTNVEVRTGAGGTTQAGNILVTSSIATFDAQTGAAPGSLTLQAHNDITISPGVTIESTTGPMAVTLNADSDRNNAGGVRLTHSNTSGGSAIRTDGGNIVMFGAGLGAATNVSEGTGIEIVGSVLDAGAGSITLTGIGKDVGTSAGRGVFITYPTPSLLTRSSLVGSNIVINGSAASGIGVAIGATDVTASGSISINGARTSGTSNFGVALFAASQMTAANGIGIASDDWVLVTAPSADFAFGPSRLVSGGPIKIDAPAVTVELGSSLDGGSITITSDDVRLDQASLVASGAVAVDSSFVELVNGSSIQGADVSIQASAFESTDSQIRALTPQPTPGPTPAPTGSGNLSITADALLLDNSTLEAGNRLALTASFIDVVGGQLQAGGPIELRSDGFVGLDGAQLTSTATGDAITIATESFSNSGSELSATSGRWLISSGVGQAQTFATDFAGLDYTFVQFNAPFGTTPAVSGVGANGVMLADPLNVQVKVDATRPYDGTVRAVFSDALSTDILSGFTVQTINPDAAVEGTFNNKNAGVDKPIAFSGEKFFVTTSDARPVFGETFSYRGDVTTRSIGITGITAADKIYDATRTATLTGTLAGVIAGDDATLSGAAGLFDNKNVGTDKTVTITGGTLAGADGSNYSLVPGGTTTADIFVRPITATGITAADKVYDGNRVAVISGGSLSQAIAGDDLTLTGATGLFDTKNAGTDKVVTISGGTLAGADSGNYSLSGTATTTADIFVRPITATGITAADKVYDGNRNAVISGSLSQAIAGDDLTLTGATGLFDTKNAGTDKVVTISGGTLGGADSGNYSLTGTATTTADIFAKPITAAGITAADKVYDGNRNAVISGGSLSQAIAGDELTLSGATGLFDTKNAGTDKVVTISGGTLAGADSGNYVLTGSPATTTADITQKALTLGIGGSTGPVTKEYDATTAATLAANQFTLGGVVANDVISVTGPVQGSYDTPNVGSQKLVTVTGAFNFAGTDAPNYSIGSFALTNASSNVVSTTVQGNVGIVTPATLTYIADPATREFGLPVLGLTGSVTGFKGADTIANATTGLLDWRTTARLDSPPGIYRIDGVGLSAGNYVFTQAPGNATALALVAPNRPSAPQQKAVESSTAAVDQGTRSVVAALSQRSFGGGVFDISTPLASRSFGPINISEMSQEELARLLEERKEFKRKLFADAIYKLEIDPSLADVQPCANVADAASGLCRITAAQLEELHATKAPAAQPAPEVAARAKTASLPQIERKIAVLFGLNDYEDKKIPKLENAIPDVDAVSRIFAEKLGYEVRVVKNPRKADIIRTLNQLSTEVNSSDSVVVYYAGHGYSLDKSGAGYWLPADAGVSDPGGWISNSDVAKLLAGIRSRQMALISDSCYSGAFARDGMGSVGRDVRAEDVLTKRSVVVLSSGGDEPVADEGKEGHSIFAWNLMKAVRNVQNWRPGSTIFTEVQAEVRKEFPQTPRYGSVTSAGHQAGGDYLFELR